MYERILVGFDGSDEGYDALHLTRGLAPENAHVVVLDVDERLPLQAGDDAERSARLRRIARSAGEGELAGCSFEVRGGTGSPARALAKVAVDVAADLIVVGSTHHGAAGRVVIGSVAESLFEGAPCPVVVAPRGYADRAHASAGLIVAGYDGTPEAGGALSEAARLARSLDARLKLVAAVPPTAGPSHALRFEQLLADAARRSSAAEVELEPALVRGNPVPVLAEQCIEADILVLGSRGRGRARRALLGSVSAAIVRMAPCPVMVVPRSAAEKAGIASAGMATQDVDRL